MIRRALLAGLLAGCSHPLPPRRAPGVWGPRRPDPSAPYAPVSKPAQAPAQAPARALPPVTLTPGPGTGMDLRPDPANPFPRPDPTLPPDARMLALALALASTLALAGCACQIACPPDVAPGVPAPPRPFDDRLLDFLGNLAGGAIQGSLR